MESGTEAQLLQRLQLHWDDVEEIRCFRKAYDEVERDFIPDNPLDSAFQIRATSKTATKSLSMRAHFVEGFLHGEKFTFSMTGMLDKHMSTLGLARVPLC